MTPCPACCSNNVLDVTAHETYVDWAICRDCGHEFAYDTRESA